MKLTTSRFVRKSSHKQLPSFHILDILRGLRLLASDVAVDLPVVNLVVPEPENRLKGSLRVAGNKSISFRDSSNLVELDVRTQNPPKLAEVLDNVS